MQDDIKLKISMLLDNELSPEDSLRLLERIERDDELRAWWIRHNATRLALKSESYVSVGDDFVRAVSEKIRQEPAILAPQQRSLRIFYSGWAAIAASIFVVGVLVVGNLPKATDETAEIVAKNDSKVVSSPQQVQAEKENASPDPRFQDYLEAHNESSYATVTPNLLPYARVVTYTKGR